MLSWLENEVRTLPVYITFSSRISSRGESDTSVPHRLQKLPFHLDGDYCSVNKTFHLFRNDSQLQFWSHFSMNTLFSSLTVLDVQKFSFPPFIIPK